MNNRNRKFSRFKASYFATGNSLPKKAQSLSGDRTELTPSSSGGRFVPGIRIQHSLPEIMDPMRISLIFRGPGMFSRQFLPNLASPFFIRLLNCLSCSFFLPCSLFEILTSQGENTNFHPDRAPHRDSDHRDSGGNAAAGSE